MQKIKFVRIVKVNVLFPLPFFFGWVNVLFHLWLTSNSKDSFNLNVAPLLSHPFYRQSDKSKTTISFFFFFFLGKIVSDNLTSDNYYAWEKVLDLFLFWWGLGFKLQMRLILISFQYVKWSNQTRHWNMYMIKPN